MSNQLLLGFDINGAKSAVIVGGDDGSALAREEVATGVPDATVTKLIELGQRLCAGERPIACGIASSGPLSSREGLILSPPNLPGWDRVPVVQRVRETFNVPTALENNANACAVAEWLWGLNGQVDDLVYLTCGIGNGAGIVLGGQLIRGRQDTAGEIGHVRLLETGPVGYHKAGSVEGLTNIRALGEIAKSASPRPHEPSRLDGLPPAEITGKAVGEAAIDGDAFAISVVYEQADYLGRTCAILIDILNPQRISLGSAAQRLGPLLIDRVREAARLEALPAAFEACVIDKAVLGERILDLSTLAIAREALEMQG